MTALPFPLFTPLPCIPCSTEPLRAGISRGVSGADEQSVRTIRGGEPGAFAEIVARYRSRILQLAGRFARNHHEQEDLAQDIFCRAWSKLSSWRGDAPFEHWFMRLATRCCYDFLRAHRTRREKEVQTDALAVQALCTGTADPEDAAENEALLLVRSAMRQLKPKEQLVLTLLELEDRTLREVSALTGWSEGNVKVRAHRARHRLREAIQSLRASPQH